MSSKLTRDDITSIDNMLSNGQKLSRIAATLGMRESTLRWRLAKAGLEVEYTGRLVPIHAAELSNDRAA